jgi:DNA-binding response OmpR family regulator
MQVLLVEDDNELSATIKLGLEGLGHLVDRAFDGTSGQRLARENKVKLVESDESVYVFPLNT